MLSSKRRCCKEHKPRKRPDNLKHPLCFQLPRHLRPVIGSRQWHLVRLAVIQQERKPAGSKVTVKSVRQPGGLPALQATRLG
jgi:hypothetical protein